MESKLAYIIPTHKKVDSLVAAIDSALGQKGDAVVFVVGPESVLNSLDDNRSERVNLVVENDNTSYSNLVNKGIEAVREIGRYEWVSILENDDQLLPEATSLFTEYRDAFPDAEMFAGLTLIVERSQDNSPPMLKTMANEACWAPNVMEESGIFDFNALLRMGFVFLNSCFIKLTVFDQVGLLKNNFRFYGDYEFTLRVVYNGLIVRGIPKATHYHFVNGEIQQQMMNDISRDEADFWSNAARKEYFFDFDREISYEPVEETDKTGA